MVYKDAVSNKSCVLLLEVFQGMERDPSRIPLVAFGSIFSFEHSYSQAAMRPLRCDSVKV